MSEDLTKATPRPWKVLTGNVCHTDRPYQIVRDHDGPYHPVTRWGSTFCVPSLPEGKANAALIIAAVNGYDASLARIAELEAEVARLQPYEDELRKIAEQVGEEDDPFAAWESIPDIRDAALSDRAP